MKASRFGSGAQMKSKSLFLFSCLTTAIFLAGCGGVTSTNSTQPPTANPTPTPIPIATPSPTPTPVATAASTFIFGIQAFESDDGYEGGHINSTNGQVTSVGAPFNSSGLGQNIVIQLI